MTPRVGFVFFPTTARQDQCFQGAIHHDPNIIKTFSEGEVNSYFEFPCNENYFSLCCQSLNNS